MRCLLMHREIAAAHLEIDDDSGFILKVNTGYAPEHFPVGVSTSKGLPDRASLNEWWADRTIPASRSGIREVLDTLGISSPRTLLLHSYGLSLSDQYWIKPENVDLEWSQINFFDNPFSEDLGDILFGSRKKSNPLNLSSPDSTSDGNLKKRWKIIEGKRCLIKGGSSPFRQQPFNEVIASEVMKRLNIPHIDYLLIWNQNTPYCICEDFVNRDIDLVPAWRIYQTKRKPNNVSVYQHFLNCAQELGIPDVPSFLHKMLVADFLIANEDRHFNNFGALRNAENLEWLGMAPIYDSGSSFGYDKVPGEILSGKNIICKPFKKSHNEQLKLVKDFSWVRIENLSGMDQFISNIFSNKRAAVFIDQNRIDAIAKSFGKRIIDFKTISDLPESNKSDFIDDDMNENIAAAYHS
ncbi:MAG: hypothetical protein II969_14310 [Anaerolineaceae bacterium]|nr:hypothetical protein [Anaerolineaceae bacterium]